MSRHAEMQDKPVTVLMVGVGGYGYFYLKTLFEQVPPDRFRLCGVVDPQAMKSGHYQRILADRIPVFDQIDDFYRAGYQAELAIIASPIQYHVPQSRVALRHGTHVLCDKPVAPVIQEADLLIAEARESAPWCMVGYQWSYSRAIQHLKRDIRAGRFGKPLRMKTLILWPRDDAYYQRNDWTGRIKDDGGQWVLDSPANNAMAHFLHNLFYLQGEGTAVSALPERVAAELYRAHPIENYDTAACRAVAGGGAELLFYASHATRGHQDPMFHLEFENAVIRYHDPDPLVLVQTRDGRSWSYGSPEDDPQFKKLFDALDAVRSHEPPVCGPLAARAQCLCVSGMQESPESVETFPRSIIQRDEENKRWLAEGLDDVLRECYRQNALPSEIGVPWARQGRAVDLRDYVRYPSRCRS